MGGACGTSGKEDKYTQVQIFGGKPRNRACENDIKMDIKGIERDRVDWMRLVSEQGVVVNNVMKHRFP